MEHSQPVDRLPPALPCACGNGESDRSTTRRHYGKRRRPTARTWVLAMMALSCLKRGAPQLLVVDSFTAVGKSGVHRKGIVVLAPEFITDASWGTSASGGGLTVCDRTERNKKHVQWDEWDEESESVLVVCSGDDDDDDDDDDTFAPPWLSRYRTSSSNCAADEVRKGEAWSSKSGGMLRESLQGLEYTLVEKEQWSRADALQVIETMHNFSDRSELVMQGMTDFLSLLLETTTATAVSATATGAEEGNVLKHLVAEQVSKGRAEQQASSADMESSPFVTKEILLAAIWHYAESRAARKQGLLSNVFIRKNVLFGKEDDQPPPQWRYVLRLPPATRSVEPSPSRQDGEQPILVTSALLSKRMIAIYDSKEFDTPFQLFNRQEQVLPLQIKPPESSAPASAIHDMNYMDSDLHMENLVVWKITRGAAQIKRAEILARAIESKNAIQGGVLSMEEAARIRGLLLTVEDFDWRSLMIRCVACLYRLEDILGDNGNTFERTPEVVLTAREGVRVYATLAQQLGLGRLKARIEDRAFQILYKRQYRVVNALYTNMRPTTAGTSNSQREANSPLSSPMESVSSYLQTRIVATLFEDDSLMAQLESLQVSARVKERFSFWKKLLKNKSKELGDRRTAKTALKVALSVDSSRRVSVPERSASEALLSTNLSIALVPDAVALRVILRARKWYENEPEETMRARERLLCYYVQQKLLSLWPAIEPERMKDYIQFPKPNGYQSLHHTSSIVESGVAFPFEVQVRSGNMHQIAEHGVASHWGYKLGNENAPEDARKLLSVASNLSEASPSSLVRTRRMTPTTPGNPYLDSSVISHRGGTTSLSGNSYLDSLSIARQRILEQQVYVFVTVNGNEGRGLSDRSAEEIGKLISVPVNARVGDAVRAMLTEYSANGFVPRGALHDSVSKCKVWRNGWIASFDDVVESGDVLMVASS